MSNKDMPAKELNNETVKAFIEQELDVKDIAYLVIPDDERLNAEALSIIKRKFKEFVQKP